MLEGQNKVKNMDIFLQPFVDESQLVWVGILDVYNAFTKANTTLTLL